MRVVVIFSFCLLLSACKESEMSHRPSYVISKSHEEPIHVSLPRESEGIKAEEERLQD